MLNWVLSKLPIVGRAFSLFEPLRLKLQGSKTYIGATILLLQGIGMLVDTISGIGSGKELLDVLRSIGSSDGIRLIGEAIAIYGGRAALKRVVGP